MSFGLLAGVFGDDPLDWDLEAILHQNGKTPQDLNVYNRGWEIRWDGQLVQAKYTDKNLE